MTIRVTPQPDCEVPSYGPGERACQSGACVDVVPYDGNFSCNCSGLSVEQGTALDANCAVVVLLQTAASSSGSSSLGTAGIAGIAGGAGAVLLLVLTIMLIVVSRRRETEQHHFKEEMRWLREQGLLTDDDRDAAVSECTPVSTLSLFLSFSRSPILSPRVRLSITS